MTTQEPHGEDLGRRLAPTPRRGAPRRDHLLPRAARFLDPTAALRFEGERLAPTSYAGDQLLLRPGPDAARVRALLTAAAEEEGYAGDVR